MPSTGIEVCFGQLALMARRFVLMGVLTLAGSAGCHQWRSFDRHHKEIGTVTEKSFDEFFDFSMKHSGIPCSEWLECEAVIGFFWCSRICGMSQIVVLWR